MIAMVLGVVAGVIASFAERADFIITGGNATPLGYVNTYTWLLVSATLFGPVGAIITTEVQAFLGLLTAANPLSWLWPFVNLVFAGCGGYRFRSLFQASSEDEASHKALTFESHLRPRGHPDDLRCDCRGSRIAFHLLPSCIADLHYTSIGTVHVDFVCHSSRNSSGAHYRRNSLSGLRLSNAELGWKADGTESEE